MEVLRVCARLASGMTYTRKSKSHTTSTLKDTTRKASSTSATTMLNMEAASASATRNALLMLPAVGLARAGIKRVACKPKIRSTKSAAAPMTRSKAGQRKVRHAPTPHPTSLHVSTTNPSLKLKRRVSSKAPASALLPSLKPTALPVLAAITTLT